MLKGKRVAAGLLAFAMIFCCCSCTTFDNFKTAFIDEKEEFEQEVYKIGVLEPFSGQYEQDAADEVLGIELAHSLYSEIDGVKVELVKADNQSEVSLCSQAAQSLIDQGVRIILGSNNSVLTLASSDVIKEAGVPAISVTNTNPLVTAANNYYFRVCFTDSYEGESVAEYVYKGLNTSSTAILLREGNNVAAALAEDYTQTMEKLNGAYDFIQTIAFPADIEDYGPYLTSLKLLNPDIVFFPSSISVAKEVLEQAKLLGYDFEWIGTSQWNGIDVEGARYVLDYDPAEPTSYMMKRFNDAYHKLYGDDKTPTDAMALGFDAYLLAIEGIRKAEDRDKPRSIVGAIEAIEDFDGATGKITMSSSGNPIKEVYVEQYRNGAAHAIYVITRQSEERSE